MGNLVDDPTTYSLEQLDQALKSERKKYALALHNAISISVLDEPVNEKNEILDYKNVTLFDSNQDLFRNDKVNKLFRAVVKTGVDKQALAEYEKQVLDATKEISYLSKIKAYRQKEEELPSDLNRSDDAPKLPVVFPRFVNIVRGDNYPDTGGERRKKNRRNIAKKTTTGISCKYSTLRILLSDQCRE